MPVRLWSRNPSSGLCAVAAAGLSFALATNAEAQELPVDVARRPLTLPEGTLRVDTAIDIFRLNINTPFGSASETFTRWITGGGFGITDDFEAGALLLPINLSPDGGFGDIQLYGMYRLLDGEAEVGARLELNIPTDTDTNTNIDTDFGIGFGLPVLLRFSDTLRVDTGLTISVIAADDTIVGLSDPFLPQPIVTSSSAGIPLVLNLNVTDEFVVGARSGITILDFDNFGDTFSIPLGAQAGYSLDISRDVLVDLGFRFEWPLFLAPGGEDAVDPINLNFYRILFGAEAYLDVL